MKRLTCLAAVVCVLAIPAFAEPPSEPTSFEGLFAKLTSQEGEAYGLEMAISASQGHRSPQGPDTAMCALGTRYNETVQSAAEKVKAMPPRPADSPISAAQAEATLNWPARASKRAEAMQRMTCGQT